MKDNSTLKDKIIQAITEEESNGDTIEWVLRKKDVKLHIDRLQKRLKEEIYGLKCYCECCAFGDDIHISEDSLIKQQEVIEIIKRIFKEEINI